MAMDLEALKGDYERDGVVRIRQLISVADVAEIRAQLDRYIRDVLPSVPEADRVLEADGVSVRNLWRVEKHDAFFRSLALRPDFQCLAETLANGPVETRGVETFSKPARVGSGVPPHQDNAYFCRRPPDVFTLWIGIDPATVQNGAVQYLLGSHREMLPHKVSGVAGNSMGLVGDPPDGYETFLGSLNSGDALAHHCQTVHFSKPNESEQSRLGLLIVYGAEHTAVDHGLKQHYELAVV